jgi:hypothetical protein
MVGGSLRLPPPPEVEMSGIEVLAVSKYSTKKAFDKSSSFIN